MAKKNRIRALSKQRRPAFAIREYTPWEVWVLELKVAFGKVSESDLTHM